MLYDYIEVLLSVNVIIEFLEDKFLCFGVFKVLLWFDFVDMGYGCIINVIGEDEDVMFVDVLIISISVLGNFSFDLLMFWNYDVGFEWYLNDDLIFVVSVYYKCFQGGFDNVVLNEIFNLNGVDVVFLVSV